MCWKPWKPPQPAQRSRLSQRHPRKGLRGPRANYASSHPHLKSLGQVLLKSDRKGAKQAAKWSSS